MALVVPNSAELELLELMLGSYSSSNQLKCKLYKNDYTPIATSVVGDFTEATFTGYASVTIDESLWSYATVDGKAVATYDSSPMEWTVTGSPHTVYGYYVTSNDGTVLYFAEKFSTALSLATDDTPQLQLKFKAYSDS